MSQINVGGVVFTIDALLSKLDSTLDKGRAKVDDFRRYAERPVTVGGPNFGGGGAGGGGTGGSRGTSGNVHFGTWDMEGGNGSMSQRYGYMGQRATASYRQSDLHGELVASRTRGIIADQQDQFDDMQRIRRAADREVRTRPGGVRGSRRYYGAAGDDYAGQGYGRGGRRPAESRDSLLESMVDSAGSKIEENANRPQRLGNFETVDKGGLRSDISTGEISGDKDAHKSTNFLNRKIQVRNLLRYTLGGIIADTLALELGNEENYRKGMALAGMDQHAQAHATLNRFTGGLRAIPVLGPALAGAFSPFTTPIETSLEMTENRIGFQGMQFGMQQEAIGNRRQAGIQNFGRNRYGRQSAVTQEDVRKARDARRSKNAEAAAEFEKTHPDFDNSPESGFQEIDDQFSKDGGDGSALNSSVTPAIAFFRNLGNRFTPGYSAFYDKKRKEFNDNRSNERMQAMALATKGMKSEDDLAAAIQRQDTLNFAEDLGLTQGETSEKILAANKKPVAGTLDRIMRTASANMTRYMADTKSPQGMAMQFNNQMSLYSDAQQVFQDARDKQLFGQSIAFNPFNESSDKFQTKEVESLDQKMQTALETMARIAQYVFTVSNGGIR